MDTEKREQLLKVLAMRRDVLVEEWFDAVARTCYVPLAATALREELGRLLDRLISVWLDGPSSEEEAGRAAQDIGADLAALHFVNAEALGQTLRVLGTLVVGLRLDVLDAAIVHPRLTSLLQGVATGYYRQGCATILDEQEQVRNALLVELRTAEASLRAAHDELEARVEERTAELAKANADLLREVAERRRVEQELRESKERWRSLVENAPDLIGTVDRDGRIRFLNRLPSRSSVDSVLGVDGATFAEKAHQAELRRIVGQVFETGTSVTRELAFTATDGTTTWYAVSFGPIWQSSTVAEVLFISRNIDHRKKLEQVKDNLIHDVSHELRTPLAKIRMSLELLGEIAGKKEPDQERVERISQLAANNVDGLIDTLEGILDLSRLEAGIWSDQTAHVALDDLIGEVAAFMQPIAREKGLLLTAAVPPRLAPVAGDRDKLQRVLVNLLDNACKFSDEGTVTISATNESDAVHVQVVDEGEGILPNNLARVFDRFFQERTRSQGVGIGLSICKAIVEAHGGTIWAESEGRGHGTTFHLVLPAVKEEDET